MPIYLGTKALEGLHVGQTEIARVYLGTKLIYRKGVPPAPGSDVVFDHGWIQDIPWAGNTLPRAGYTLIAKYDFSDVESLGYMRIYFQCDPNYSAIYYNAHVCTDVDVRVPSTATVMKIEAVSQAGAQNANTVKFGLVTRDCVNATDASAGGVLSDWLRVNPPTSGEDTHILSVDISGIDKSQNWVPVVNARHLGQDYKTYSLYIYKVWFE